MVERVETPALQPVETPHTDSSSHAPPKPLLTGRRPGSTSLTGPASMSVMPYMYILECSDGSYYVGSTWNVDRRLSQHNAGEGAQYTRTRHPVRLLYVEEYFMIKDAFAREKQVQGWSRRKRRALIEGRTSELPRVSRTTQPRSTVDVSTECEGGCPDLNQPDVV